jgi:hypothetical protein
LAKKRAEDERLDVLVNDIFGGDVYAQFGKPLWEHDLAGGPAWSGSAWTPT